MKNVDEAKELLKNYRDNEDIISWSIYNIETGEFVGTYWIAPAETNGEMIIISEAQRIGKKFWRKGFTREARQLVYRFAFEE
ncbi:MAG: GNAT family N-acetyltransferase [Bacillaceae bacterium]|nr:GNAT family N-acetyltransferase [Bacillaceae bacterium]